MKRYTLMIVVIATLSLFFYNKFSKNESAEIIENEEDIVGISSLEREVQDGDIIFQTSRSSQSKAIQLATDSKYSHMGIIFEKDGKQLVYEAIQPVQFTPLKQWIARGEGNHYVIKRLKNADDLLTTEVVEKMKSVGKRFYGKKYDIYFQWSDDAIYCSELVWKIYEEVLGVEIGELEKLADFDLSHETVKEKIKERYGDHIPTSEQFISPAAMFDSEKLMTIDVQISE